MPEKESSSASVGDRLRNGIEFLSSVDMRATWSYFLRMNKVVQLRHVSGELHCKLKARAVEGLFPSDYLLREVRRAAERPTTVNELAARPARRASVAPGASPARALRAESL